MSSGLTISNRRPNNSLSRGKIHKPTAFRKAKVIALVFWDSQGAMLIGFLEKGCRMTAVCHPNIPTHVQNTWETRLGMLTKAVLFYHNNAPVHTFIFAITILDWEFEVIPPPPYSPDTAPNDFYLFSNMKKALAGRCFANDSEVIDAVTAFLGIQEKSCFKMR